ncbi:type VI secretion system Vgr family protein [Flavobacterium sharifuzzamanii]|uniref:type VI secretion system Vgr family protein n=1 Tax=Flavobacterium sharifuzzamanii TaxID=2211133 RepID=UPI000DAB6C92|nr:phage baseplate assembly protein V [Flavobacterium sharifuzzamanii]KAF2082935.1 type IV secretion protein Rhs [Flavobacterium sharifuzzamanii]
MSQFSEQVKITIEGFTQNVIYYNLELSQKMADHHHFSFFWQYSGKTIIEPQDQEKAFSNYIGNEVIFTFKVNGIQLMSKGRITRLESLDKDGSPDGLQVFGVSHTIVLDEMPKSRIFLEKNLQQIALEIFAEENSGEFYQREAIVPTYIKEFKFKTQYSETNFDFLKRLSKRYAQWFYFDGMRMQFGKIKNTDIRIINESSLHKLKIEANLVSQKASFGGYDYANAANIKYGAEKTAQGSRDRFASIAGFKQPYIVRPGLQNGAYTNNAQNKEEIEEMVKMQTAGNDANSIFYSGISYLPIGLGQTFILENKTVEHHLLAIEIIHRSEVNGNYTCEFRAIPADAAAPHYTDVNAFVATDSQSASVIDNNDPKKMGRVKVQYYWDAYNSKSDWMRVVQHYAGSGKGLYFRPEIGEEVLISFEGGNADCPYASGAYYNGKEMPDFFDSENRIKGWKLPFGMLFKFIEKVCIILSDPSGNELHMNEETKSTTITAPETLTLNCKNLIINASESITTTAGMNIAETAGIDKSTTVGGMLNTNITGNSMFYVGGNHDENIEGDLNSDVKKDKNYIVAGKDTSNSENGHEFHSNKTIKNNSAEDTRQN